MRISDDARRGLDRVATRYGVTLTALLEAMGRYLDEDPTRVHQGVIETARQIDFERRSRR